MLKRICGLACAVLMGGAAAAADLSQTGPLASAESIINARAQFREDGLEFGVDIKGGTAPGLWTVDLAPDFNVVFDGNAKSTTYDYALKRIITLDDSKHSIVNTSLYAIADFQVAETFNRRAQRALLVQLKSAPQPLVDVFWVQSELHVLDPADGTPKILRKPAKDGSVAFLYGGKEVASYALSAQTLKKEESARLARYLTANVAIHPSIIAEIVASGRMPARISYSLSPAFKKPPVTMVFKPAVPVKSVYPLRKGEKIEPLSADPNGSAATLQSVLQVMQSAIAGQAPGKRSAADFRIAIEKAMEDSHPFQALLLAFEVSEQHGEAAMVCAKPDGCHTMVQIIAQAEKDDPRAIALHQALDPQKGHEDAAIKTLTDMKRDDLSNGYVLDDFLANDLVTAGRADDAMPLFATAIKGNPYLAGYYKDLGDAYRAGFEPALAWLCYDIGRALPGGTNAPVISRMNDYEAALETKYPQFF